MFNLVSELRFQLLITQESNTERQVWGKIKDSFVEESFVWGGLTNGCEKKRNKRQKRKGKTDPFECRVPRNTKER